MDVHAPGAAVAREDQPGPPRFRRQSLPVLAELRPDLRREIDLRAFDRVPELPDIPVRLFQQLLRPGRLPVSVCPPLLGDSVPLVLVFLLIILCQLPDLVHIDVPDRDAVAAIEHRAALGISAVGQPHGEGPLRFCRIELLYSLVQRAGRLLRLLCLGKQDVAADSLCDGLRDLHAQLPQAG